MDVFSQEAHLEAVARRRIKFVVEKGAMARRFKKGTHSDLQESLFQRLQSSWITSIRTRDQYDEWLLDLVKDNCWHAFSQDKQLQDRWGYFAKLLNIVIYELVTHRELASEQDWERVQWFLHVPLDELVFFFLQELDTSFPIPSSLTGWNESQYMGYQKRIRELAAVHKVPPIRFEDAWVLRPPDEELSEFRRSRQLDRSREKRVKTKAALDFLLQKIMGEKSCGLEEAKKHLKSYISEPPL